MSRLLLENMKHVNGLFKAHSVDSTVSAATIILNDLQYRCIAKPFQRFST